MYVVPLIPAHLKNFDLQEEQLFVSKYMDENYMNAVSLGIGYTGIVDGKPVACAGILPVNERICSAWALLSKDACHHLLGITRQIVSRLDGLGFARVETTVRHGFKEGHRWARMLGFTNETPSGMRGVYEKDDVVDLYAKVIR